MKMKNKIGRVLKKLAEDKVNGIEVPKTVADYVSARMQVKERLLMEAQDTAHMHGAWVLEYEEMDGEQSIDEIGWLLLYQELSKQIEGVPVSFFRALSFGLSSDKMVNTMKCKYAPEILDMNPSTGVAVAFDGAKMGLWEMDEVKKFCMQNYPSIPIFDEEEWKKSIMERMGGFATDMEDMEVPEGGNDVFLF
jgi:hypothetical protein